MEAFSLRRMSNVHEVLDTLGHELLKNEYKSLNTCSSSFPRVTKIVLRQMRKNCENCCRERKYAAIFAQVNPAAEQYAHDNRQGSSR
jgi:hypothetical protein